MADSVVPLRPLTINRVDGQPIRVMAEKDPSALPWGEMGVTVVLEATGRFCVCRDLAAQHLAGG